MVDPSLGVMAKVVLMRLDAACGARHEEASHDWIVGEGQSRQSVLPSTALLNSARFKRLGPIIGLLFKLPLMIDAKCCSIFASLRLLVLWSRCLGLPELAIQDQTLKQHCLENAILRIWINRYSFIVVLAANKQLLQIAK